MKFLKYTILLYIVINTLPLSGQTPTWNWARDVYSNQDEEALDVAVDPATEDIYVVGYWERDLSAHFPAGALPSEDFSWLYGDSDGFVAKYDNTGALLWAFKVGCNRDDRVNAVTVDPSGNIYITGYFEDNTAEFTGTGDLTGGSSTLTNADNNDNFFIAKYNANGELLWVNQGESVDRDIGGVDVAAYSNGVFAVGYYNDDTDFGALTVPDNGQYYQHFVVAYDNNGNEQWAAYATLDDGDYNGRPYMNSVATDGTDVFVSGNFKRDDYRLFDKNDNNVATVWNYQDGNGDIVLMSFAVNGDFNWLQQIGGTNYDQDWDIVLDTDSIYLTGGIGNNANFPGYTSNPVSSSGGMDIFVSSHAKTDGNTGWVQSIPSTDGGNQEGTSITLDSYSNIFITGYYDGDLTFPDSTLTPIGNNDGFIASFTNNGTFYWTKTIGSAGNDIGYGIASGGTDKVYAVGAYEDQMDLDGIILTNDALDNMYIGQINPCTDAVGGTASAANSSFCVGDSTTLTLTGYSGSIQWQSSPKAMNSWSNITGETTASMVVKPTSSKDFRAIVSSFSCQPDTSNQVTVNVHPLPTATISGDASICEGNSSTITINFTGTAPYDFTYSDGSTSTNVTGHGTNTYNFNVSPSDTAVYTVPAVSDANSCSNTGTGSATINVIPEVTITTQPTDKQVCPGSNVNFNVKASGANLTYQWKKDGVDIPGETNASLVLNSVATSDAAIYTCVVSSSCGGPLTTNDAELTLFDDVAITTHPADAHLCDGEQLNLTVAATGSGITYQWQKDGVDIAGENSSLFTINAVSSSDVGLYTCEVAGVCDTIESDPANILVDDPIVITSQPTNKQACPGDNTSFTVTATGSSLTYQWQKDGVDMAGQTSQSLILNNIAAADAAIYRCIITSPCGETKNSQSASLTVHTTTAITTEPSDVTECEGNNTSLSVVASGTSLTYQWYKDGVALADGGSVSGSQSDVLVFTGLAVSDAGEYYCEVTGTCGTLNSQPADLVVDDNITITTQPTSKTSCEGNNISFSITATGSNLSYQWQKDGANIAGATTATLNINSVTAADEADYRCVLSNSCGAMLNSNTVSLTVDETTAITLQPSDAVECEGNNVSFSITATGTNLTYQWYKDGAALANGGDISGALSQDLVVSNLAVSDAGTYHCNVSGNCGVLNSDPAELTVDDNITITTQPQDIQACEGDNISFNVVASGSNLTYQWQKDGANIAGATNSVLSLSSISAADEASYRCVISNSCGATVNSQAADLTLYTNTAITTQPTGVTRCIGGNASFTVSATGSNLTYQWKKDGAALVSGGNISGALTNTLNITGILAGDNGVYTCEVSGSCGTINSDPANLTLKENTSISVHPAGQAVCEDGNAVFNVTASGTNLTYQWQKDGVNIPGATSSGYIINNVTTADAGVFRCVVTGDCGTVNSNGALLTINKDITITSQPTADEVCENESAGFSIAVAGTSPTYQWRLNGSDLSDGGSISGANTPDLTIDPATLAHDGTISCVVTGTCSNETSNTVSLTVNEEVVISSHPQNKTACPSDNVLFNVSATGTNLTYQWQKDGVDIGGETNSALLLNNVTSADAGLYRCVVTGTCGVQISNAASLAINSNVLISADPVSKTVCTGSSAGFTVTASGTGLTYQWKKDGVDLVDGGNISGATTNNLSINPAALTDAGSYVCEVTGTCGTVNSAPASLTVNESISITTNPQSKTACPDDDIVFNVVAEGSNLTYQWQKDGVDMPGETNSGLLLSAVTSADAATYRCVVDGDCGTLNSAGANLTINADVSITTQPADEEVCEGSSAGFVINATGTGLTYQWKRNNVDLADGGAISGVNTNSLSIDPVSLSDAGVFTCEVIGTCGTENSNPANLVVDENITISAHPSNLTACPGENASFSVTASGTNLTYQWQKDGVDIGGETSSVLNLTNVNTGDAGVYRCVINGDCGTLISNGASLTIDQSVTITSQPAVNPTLCEGDNLNLSITATGTSLSYQWRKDGVDLSNGGDISGAQSDNLIISNVDVSDDGIYTCVVTGSCGSLNSNLSDVVVHPTTAIITHPVKYTITAGGNASFSVDAEGDNLTYQWQKDGVNLSDGGRISGATASTLDISNVIEADEGAYRCVVTGTCNTIASNPADLVVNPTSSILTQPSDITRCEGESAAFSITASGTGNTYQWQKDGVDLVDDTNISGTTTANLNIDVVSLSDDGAYTCVVNSETSAPAILTVNENTIINTNPTTISRCEGDGAIFSINASGTSLSYQWQKDGVNLSNGGTISGVNTATLSISSVVTTDADNYRCVVTGACGIANSAAAGLVVYTNTLITSQPVGNTICKGSSHTFNVVADGDNLSYTWRKDGVDLTDGGNISGSSTASLTISSATLADEGAYTCEVTGECGSENSIIAQLFVEESTNITLQPANATGCTGDNISFSVLAEGESLTYQWQKDGVNLSDGGTISGATTANLTISGIVPSDEGSYVCIVTGNCGVENSNAANLTANETIAITTQPTGDIICAGQSTSLSVSATGSNLTYQWRKGGTDLSDGGNISGTNSPILNISNAVLTDDGTYSCEITGSCGTVVSNLADIEVRRVTQITKQPVDEIGCNGDNISFSVNATGHNLTYQWQKDGVNIFDGGTISGTNTNVLSISGIIPGDAGSYRCVVSGYCNTINSNPAVLSSYENTSITSQPTGATLCEGNSVNLNVSANGDDLSFQWMRNGVALSDGGNISGSNTANLSITNAALANAGNYTVEVSGQCGTENSNLAVVEVDSVTQILQHPVNTSGCEGDNISFSVSATGENVTYQWQKDGVNLSNGGTISGATSSLLTINGIVPGDEGAYRCVVTGDCNTLTSNPATLDAYSNTAITAQPTDKTVCEGTQVLLNVSATGDNLTYQWKKDGVALTDGANISGSTTASLIINSSATTNSGIYTCLVSGACGTENSSSAVVDVLANTVIQTQPQNKTRCEGDVAVFNVSATGENISYQWQKDGSPLSDGGNIFGSNTASLTVNNVTLADAAAYRCVITGVCGTINSDGADLVVNAYPAAAGTIIGPTSVCQGDSNIVFEVAAIANADTYIWDLPVGATIVSGASTRVIEVNFSDSEAGGNIFVRGQNTCGDGPVSAAHNVVAHPAPSAQAGADQNVCVDNTTLDAVHPGTANGSWSVISGPAVVQDVNLNTSTVSNLREGSNTFVWTVEQNGCSSSDTVVVSNNYVEAEAGTNQTICTESITLNGNTPSAGASGSWSVVTGAATFSSGSSPDSEASDFAPGINILKWTLNKGTCSDYDTVVIDNQAPSTAYAGIDQSICGSSTTMGAADPAVGSGTWNVISGSATFADASQHNTTITNLAKGSNILRWTVNNGICSSIDEVTINNNKVSVDAGIDQVLCDRTTDLEAVAPVTGTGNWSVISGSASFVNNNLHNTKVTGLAKGENVLAWNIDNNGCISSDTVSITNDSPTTADAGNDQTITADFTTLQANIPAVGTGSWSLIAGSATIADPSLYNTNVSNLALGENTFRWTISHNSCVTYDEVIINNFTPTDTDAGQDQTLCSDNTTLDGNEPAFGFGEWSVVQGSATFTDESDPKTTVTGLAPGDNVLRWTVWQNGYSSDDVVITNDSPTQAAAGSDQVLCADSATLAGNDPVIGGGKWTVISGSGTFVNDTVFNTKVRNMAKGENIYKWTVTNKSCITSDNVSITNDLPTAADAGTDQILCVNKTTLSPNTPAVGSGSWSVISGSAVFNGNDVTKLATGQNTLRWTITNNACSLYDDIVITNNTPTKAQAGADKVICSDSISLSANTPNIGSGVWTIQNGSGTIDNTTDPTSLVTDINQGINVFRWTVSYNGCTNYDEVTITNSLIEATTGPDQELCANTTVLEANNPESGEGLWTVLGGSGSATFDDATQPDTRVSNLDRGPNILRWTVVNDICESHADVVINNNLPTVAFAGPDEALCEDSTILQAETPAIGVGEWSILSGSAVIENENNPKSKISGLSYGINNLRWTVSNKGCTSTDEVAITNNATVPSNAGSDVEICSDSTELFGNNPQFGQGQWSVVSGSATFTDNNNYNTTVTDLEKGTNVLRWIISNGECTSTDDVTVVNNAPSTPQAGADQTVCGDQTMLSANNPSIGTGQWILMSGAAQFENNTQYNTRVTNLNPGGNTLRWRIEHEGCQAYDDVVITNDLPRVADAGQDMEVCNSSASVLANDPESGVGQWTVISGSATISEASDFSTDITNLGFGTNTLRWTITYDQCQTTDEIKIINNQLDLYAGIDQVVGESSTLLAANNPSTGSGQWEVVGGGGNFDDPSNSITTVRNMSPGLNTYRWSVNINGCVSYDDVSVTYNVPPAPSFVVTNTAGCPPLDVYFVNNSPDDLAFTWDFDDGNTSSEITLKHTYTEPGTYHPTLTVIGNAGEVIQKDTTITVFDVPDMSFLVVNREVYIPEEEALFINNTTNGVSYLWEFGDGETSTERDPKYIYETPGVYDVTLHAWTENECYDTLVKHAAVEVMESGTITYPNAFTPNIQGPSGGSYNPDDFSNDVFFPIGEGVDEYRLEIFNKWGVLVFESNDFEIGWDGYRDGKLLEEGVYVWKVSGRYNNGKEFKKIGTVMLIR